MILNNGVLKKTNSDEATKLKDNSGGGVVEKIIVDEETKNLVQELKAIIETQATTITNQAIAINKQSELLDKVDTDLNGLVGDVSE